MLNVERLGKDINNIISSELPEFQGRCKEVFEVEAVGGFYFIFEKKEDWIVYFAPSSTNSCLRFHPGEIVEVGNTDPNIQPFKTKAEAKAFIQGIEFRSKL